MVEQRATFLIAASIVVIVGLIVSWTFISSGQQETAGPITEVTDARAIANSVQLSRVSIATSENFARQKIYVITAHLKNLSNRPLRMAEVKLVFTDFNDKPVHEYSQAILNSKQKPVLPGVEYEFEVRQENLPRSWNYRVPLIEVTKLGY